MTIEETNKDLSKKAVDIKGKKYILVSDRVLAFNEIYEEGSITTELVSPTESNRVVVKATVAPDAKRIFTGYAQETIGEGYINKSSALENCETSAVGRALAMMGIGVLDSIASVDEINKAQNSSQQAPQAPKTAPQAPITEEMVKSTFTPNTPAGEAMKQGMNQEMNVCTKCGKLCKKPYTLCYTCNQNK